MSSEKQTKEYSEKGERNEEKPCRTCMDFRSWMRMNRTALGKQSTESEDEKSVNQMSRAMKNFPAPVEDDYGGRGSRKKKAPPINISTDANEEEYAKWGMALKFGCPSDSLALGRGSWRLLHTIAAYFPESPSDDVKSDMKSFIRLFSQFYPCPPCAQDFREWIRKNPPDVSSKASLSRWFCNAHNDVNRKLGKPEFDCSLVDQRWYSGWEDGSCD